MLNTIAAEAFQAFADELEKAEDFEFALNALIRREITAHQRIIFNGNGYTDEWVAEATRRGLPNLRSMVDAVPELVKPASIALFAHQGVFTEKELRARADVSFELYAKTINIEALTMIDMAGKDIVPAVAEYGGKLAWSANQAMQAGMDVSVQREMLARVNVLLRQTSDALADLRAKQEKMAGAFRAGAGALCARRHLPGDGGAPRPGRSSGNDCRRQTLADADLRRLAV